MQRVKPSMRRTAARIRLDIAHSDGSPYMPVSWATWQLNQFDNTPLLGYVAPPVDVKLAMISAHPPHARVEGRSASSPSYLRLACEHVSRSHDNRALPAGGVNEPALSRLAHRTVDGIHMKSHEVSGQALRGQDLAGLQPPVENGLLDGRDDRRPHRAATPIHSAKPVAARRVRYSMRNEFGQFVHLAENVVYQTQRQ